MQVTQINNTDELIKKLNSLPNNFAYRGQSDAGWSLQTSLERHVSAFEKMKMFEGRSIESFKHGLSMYAENTRHPNSKLAWLSLMQHYGVPTRLLDFSTSPYVALYFAIESAEYAEDGNFALFAIDYDALVRESCSYVGKINSGFLKYSDDFFTKCEEAFEEIIDINSYDVLWFVDPRYLNSRMEKQGGTFLISGSFNKPIEDLLNSHIYDGVCMEKILIPKQFFKNIYALLRKMNIGPKSIYGDLFGLAKHIQLELKIYGK